MQPATQPDEPEATGWSGRLSRLAGMVPSVLFGLVFVIFNYKIVTRYLEHDEAAWADEVSVILFICVLLICFIAIKLFKVDLAGARGEK